MTMQPEAMLMLEDFVESSLKGMPNGSARAFLQYVLENAQQQMKGDGYSACESCGRWVTRRDEQGCCARCARAAADMVDSDDYEYRNAKGMR